MRIYAISFLQCSWCWHACVILCQRHQHLASCSSRWVMFAVSKSRALGCSWSHWSKFRLHFNSCQIFSLNRFAWHYFTWTYFQVHLSVCLIGHLHCSWHCICIVIIFFLIDVFWTSSLLWCVPHLANLAPSKLPGFPATLSMQKQTALLWWVYLSPFESAPSYSFLVALLHSRALSCEHVSFAISCCLCVLIVIVVALIFVILCAYVIKLSLGYSKQQFQSTMWRWYGLQPMVCGPGPGHWKTYPNIPKQLICLFAALEVERISLSLVTNGRKLFECIFSGLLVHVWEYGSVLGCWNSCWHTSDVSSPLLRYFLCGVCIVHWRKFHARKHRKQLKSPPLILPGAVCLSSRALRLRKI